MGGGWEGEGIQGASLPQNLEQIRFPRFRWPLPRDVRSVRLGSSGKLGRPLGHFYCSLVGFKESYSGKLGPRVLRAILGNDGV